MEEIGKLDSVFEFKLLETRGALRLDRAFPDVVTVVVSPLATICATCCSAGVNFFQEASSSPAQLASRRPS